ncbi:hypothetical protein LTR10_001110 [Elasticomyces elasticus]|nr:hypothetical protein LTR10_001110 [Elasticomyces elasticus]KAK4965524.1 hypothetical protein LTR42_012280 [Elasticomyces elasticus]
MLSEETSLGQGTSTADAVNNNLPAPPPNRQSSHPPTGANEQPGQLTGEPEVSSTGRPLSRASPQRQGSSRENDMQRSSTPPEGGSIRYTRTGRVSKATKGQRVHQCEECGKLYTRAEHLRRHKQNHKPGAFVCNIPGCARSFYREDLLVRHKERHNDPFDPPTRRASIGSTTSGHGFSGPSASAAIGPASHTNANANTALDERLHNVPATTSQQSTASRVPERKYIPLNELNAAPRISIPAAGGLYTSQYPYGVTHEPSPPFSPTGYDSPTDEYSYASGPPYYSQPPQARARIGSTAGTYGAYGPAITTQSPVSAGSSTMYLPQQWGIDSQSPAGFPHYTSSTGSEVFGPGAESGGNFFPNHLVPIKTNGIVLRMITAEERDAIEAEDLIVPGLADRRP